MSEPKATLYLVATPLGNLSDLSPRAREVLSRACFIAGESKGVARRWLEILKPEEGEWVRPGLLTYREASRDRDGRLILERLRQGRTIALISDAGTPAVSDPGWHLVDQAREEGIEVVAIPGPCAAVMALTVAGFPTRRFQFEGFLPSTGRLRREVLESFDRVKTPIVIYESPHRVLETLQDFTSLKERPLLVARELTKMYEESWRGSSRVAAEVWKARTVKGEFTLVLGPLAEVEEEEPQLDSDSLALVKGMGLPAKQATELLKHFYPAVSKKTIYRALHSGP